MVDPVGVVLVELGLGVDHLGLHPEAELHVQSLHGINELFQPVGELALVHVPVAQAVLDAVPLAEPAVVQHEQFGAQLLGLLGQLDLVLAVHMELGGFPGVVQHRPQPLAHDVVQGKAVQVVAHRLKAGGRIAAQDGRGAQALPRGQLQKTVVGVDAHLDQRLPVGGLFHHAAEVAAHPQRPEEDLAGGFGGVPVQDEVGVVVVAGGAPAVLDEDFAVVHLLGEGLLLGPPVAVHVGEIQVLIGNVELGAVQLLDLQGLLHLVFQHHAALHQVIGGVELVAQVDAEGVVVVLQVEHQLLPVLVFLGVVPGVPVHQLPGAVGKGGLEAVLFVAQSPVDRELLRGDLVHRVVGGYFGKDRHLQLFCRGQLFAPVQVPHQTLIVNAEGITGILGAEQENGAFGSDHNAHGLSLPISNRFCVWVYTFLQILYNDFTYFFLSMEMVTLKIPRVNKFTNTFTTVR